MSDDPERTSGEADQSARPVGRRSWGPDEASPADDRTPGAAQRAARAADQDAVDQDANDRDADRGPGKGNPGADRQGTEDPGEGGSGSRPRDGEPADTTGRAAEQPGDQDADPAPTRPSDGSADADPGDEAASGESDRAAAEQRQPAAQQQPTPRSTGQQHAAAPRPAGKQHTPPRPPQSGPERTPRTQGQAQSGDQRYSAGELIAQLTPQTPRRSRSGWRARLGLAPTQRELDEDRDTGVAKTAFGRPVTIMVANPKGGAGKTPTALLLAAAFGLARGGGVVAWDNNELRGTMPDRSASPHRRNVRDLLAANERLQRSDSQFTELAHFLNHQASGTFYTLGSAQTSERVISEQDFRQVHEILARFFQVLVVDTGNNEAAPNWLAVAEVADCLVVPTKWRSDSLIPAARMLETLQDANPELLRRTVIAATNGPADSQAKVKANGASWFGSSHPIVEVPTDPHIAEGGVLDYAQLKPATRRAALQLAAEVARRLAAEHD